MLRLVASLRLRAGVHPSGKMRRMTLDLDDHVMEGLARAQAFVGEDKIDDAKAVYEGLLDELRDDPRQAAAVAHMYAIIVDDPGEKLAINEESLRLAEAVGEDAFPVPLRATLFANIGWSHLVLGDRVAATGWYERAEEAAAGLGDDDYGNMMRNGIAAHLAKLSG